MIDNLSKEESSRILLLITRELILHSKTPETLELERNLVMIRKLEKIKKSSLRKPVAQSRPVFQRTNPIPYRPSVMEGSPRSSSPVSNVPEPVFNIPSNILSRGNVPKLVIPDVNLPERFQYLKPIPTREELDLGKLNPLIRNPQIREIECDGPDTEVVIKNPTPKKTDIFLTTEEIKNVFLAFSKAAKIPIEENIVKIAAGSFVLNGINSDVIGSKFVIRRIQTTRVF